MIELAVRLAAYAFRRRSPRLSSMQLTEEDIKEFQAIWKAESGETLATDDARHCATRLMHLYLLLVLPLPGDQTHEQPPSPTT